MCTVLSRYTDVQLAVTDPRFVSPGSARYTADQPVPDVRLDRFKRHVSARVRPLLDQLAVRTSFDAVSEYAQPLSAHVGSHQLTAAIISNGILSLLTHRDQLLVFHRSPPRGSLDELLRFDSPVQRTVRVAVSDVELAEGDVVGAGELVVIFIGAANRDYEVFVEPDQLVHRPNAARHLALVGAVQPVLARVAADIAITELLCVFPELRLGGAPPCRGAQFDLRGLQSLDVLCGTSCRM
jgi:hypothetical protein